MRILIIALVCLAVVSQAKEEPIPTWVYDSFATWSAKWSMSFGTPSEREYRVGVYYANLKYIEETNAKQDSYKLELNGFASWTPEEFKEKRASMKIEPSAVSDFEEESAPTSHTSSSSDDVVDWVAEGAVTSVSNQGECASGYAFSAAGALEGIWQINGNDLVKLSAQQLVDCSYTYGNYGCYGGWMDAAFKYAEERGIEDDDDYPYNGRKNRCQYNSGDVVFKVSGYHNITPRKKNDMLKAIEHCPVSTPLDSRGIMFYSSGIFNDPYCGDELDHGMLIVGYDMESSSPYYTLKNSWGTTWGEDGYIRIAMLGDGDGICGMYLAASYPEYSK